MRSHFRVVVGLALALVACTPDDQITVTNSNSPDGQRALSTPADVENLIAGSFATWYSASFGANDNINNQMTLMAMESGSALANFAMGPRGAIPRSAITNVRQNSVSAGNTREFNQLSRAAAAAALGVARIGSAAGQLTLGSTSQDNRAKAFGYFVMAISHGYLALTYDSAAFITTSTVGQTTPPPIVGTDSVYLIAMAQFDSALAYAATASFPLPTTWVPSNPVSSIQFAQIVRSYRAKIRASMARTPAQRAAVNWALVLADAQAGITADLQISTNTTTLYNPQWPAQQNVYSTWHQMPPTILGMADTSGGYVNWITMSDMSGRGNGSSNPPFLIVTPDKRFPQGSTLTAQIISSASRSTAPFQACNWPTIPVNPPAPAPANPLSALPLCSANTQIPDVVAGVPGGRPYFRARVTGENNWDGTWNNSPYDFLRYRAWYAPPSNRAGNYPLFLKAEVFGLAAEAAYRTGLFALASGYVDSTRVPAGLPAISPLALTAAGTVQGAGSAAGCIPKVPTGALGPVVCGGLLEAIKYEKRLEVIYTSFGAWFFDSRGWGDLPAGTSLQWATPWQEFDTRFKGPYDRPASEVAGVSGYGW